MRAYLVTTGTAFGLLVVAHIWRLFVEGVHPLREPDFLLTTVGSIAACVWAIVLLRTRRDPRT